MKKHLIITTGIILVIALVGLIGVDRYDQVANTSSDVVKRSGGEIVISSAPTKLENKRETEGVSKNEIGSRGEETCSKVVEIPDADGICLDGSGLEFDYSFVSGDSSSEREEALKNEALRILTDNTLEDSSETVDYLSGRNVCEIFLVQNLFKKSGQGDEYHVLFCDNAKEPTVLMRVLSGGRTADGREYVTPVEIKPYAAAMVADGYGYTLEQLREKSRFPYDSYPPVTYDEALQKVESVITGELNVSPERKMVSLATPQGTVGLDAIAYEFTVTDETGVQKPIFVHAFYGTIFTEKERDEVIEQMNRRQEVINGLSDNEYYRLEADNKLDEYLDKKVQPSEKFLELRADREALFEQMK